MTTLYEYFFGEDEAAAPPAATPTTGAGSTAPESPPPASPGPTRPSDVPDAGRDVEEIIEPCTRFQGQVIEVTSIANAVPVTVGGTAVSAPYWTLGPPSFEDGINSTHPAAVPTEAGSDLEMTIKIDVTSADGLSGNADLVGTLSDGTTIELKGTFPVSVGVHSVTVKMDTATTVLARHRGDIVWEATVPGCGSHIIGRTRVEIYRIIRDHPAPFLSAGRPAEALRFIFENMSVNGTDVATSIASSDLTVTAHITTYLHNGHGLTYDIDGGRAAYFNRGSTTFFLLKYIAKSLRNVVNCYDQAAGVVALAAVIGIDGFTRFVGGTRQTPQYTFGYIHTTTLVGGIVTNNPFYPLYSGSAIETDFSLRGPFGNHQFYMDRATGLVFDACAGPHLGTEDYMTYMEASVDTTVVTREYPTPAAWRAAWQIDDQYRQFTSIS